MSFPLALRMDRIQREPPGEYLILAEVVRVGFPVRAARTYLNRHLGNPTSYRLVEAQRGETIGSVREIEVQPRVGGVNIRVHVVRVLPDGSPATHYTPPDLVELQTLVEADDGGDIPPLRSRDQIILHIPVRSDLRFLPGVFR